MMAVRQQVQSQSQATTAPNVRGRRRFNIVPYLFVLPHLIFFVGFLGWPFFYGIFVSLFDYDFSDPEHRPFVGLQNYLNLFDPNSLQFSDFWRAAVNTLTFVVWSVPPLVIVGLLLAVLLNSKLPGRNIYRAIFFTPWSLSAVVASLLGWWIFQDGGILNQYIIGLGAQPNSWLGQMPWPWFAITLTTVWWTVGFNTVIFLAALQDISSTLYEAAAIDGANKVQQFFGITLPLLRPVIFFIVTMQIIASANLFVQPRVITGGGPALQTESLIMRIATESFTSFRMGSGAAMCIIFAVILLVLTALNFRLFGRTEQQ
jgi:multiple sugar transport system permease protein